MADKRGSCVEITGYKVPYRIWENGTVESYRGSAGWKPLATYFSYSDKKHQRKKLITQFIGCDGKKVTVHLAREVYRLFRGPIPPGMCVTHRNNSISDCAAWNLYLATRQEISRKKCSTSRRPVVQLSMTGEVIRYFPSIRAASKATHMSYAAVRRRLTNSVQNPFSCAAFTFQYEE